MRVVSSHHLKKCTSTNPLASTDTLLTTAATQDIIRRCIDKFHRSEYCLLLLLSLPLLHFIQRLESSETAVHNTPLPPRLSHQTVFALKLESWVSAAAVAETTAAAVEA